ncbi:replication protein A 32 kDa subunit B [Lactuca sativa]|uniref:replication protein A 32 kDa subunit B n=1 Tax=Lactuca sativa TaxID=4236 RepID=UPI0022AEC571|nr:replication protein A 32 kDa subunit B [Lactuca sativa]
MILNKAERVTDLYFLLDDGTGRIDCNRWVHEPVDTKEMEAITEGMYVRVHGQLKGFHGKKQLVVFACRLVTDFHEITHHFVECIYVHSYNINLMVKFHNSTPSFLTLEILLCHVKFIIWFFTGQYVVDGLYGIDKRVITYLQLPANL